MQHPLTGGAEVVNEELAKKLVVDGHEVLFVVGGFAGGSDEETRDGFKIIRVGGRFSVYWYAYRYYKKHLQGWADLVIDEVNTVPFFAKFYVKEKNILFVHQLAREIWFYQMFFPLSVIGYLLEPLYLRTLSDRKTITVSNSTKNDLQKYGFKLDHIHIISEGIQLTPVANLENIQKYETPTLLSLGAVRPMKRTLHIVQAFEQAKKALPDLQLILAGDTSGAYGATVLRHISHSPCKKDIQVLGKVSKEKKVELLQKSHLIVVTSVKEGWGLVVTEANSQGTPAVVYNVDGLRDSVKDWVTGAIVAQNTPQKLANKVVELLRDTPRYSELRENAWKWSNEITFENSYRDFINVLRKEFHAKIGNMTKFTQFRYSKIQKLRFLLSYVYFKLIIPIEVISPRLELLFNELHYSTGKIFSSYGKKPLPYKISKVITKFGIFNIRSDSFDSIWASSAFERRDMNKLMTLIARLIHSQKKVLFLDIGADFGTYSIAVGNRFRNYQALQIHAFEPARESFDLLSQNINENNLSNMIRTHNFGLLDSNTKVELYLDENDSGSNTIQNKNKLALRTEVIEVRELDNIDIEYEKFDVIILKIDVEGVESQVLIGATKLLASKATKYFMVEDFVNIDVVSFLEKNNAKFLGKVTDYNSWWMFHK